MQKKSSVFYINTILSIVAILLIVNTFNLPGHTFIKRAFAAIDTITGQGTLNYLARFTSAVNPNYIGDSIIYDDGAGHVGIGGTISPSAMLDVNGAITARSGCRTLPRGQGKPRGPGVSSNA